MILKQKKEFRKGRSVIACNNTITEKLQCGTASAIGQMIQTCFPQHFGSVPLPQLHVILTLTNDDLVGFFNSVPKLGLLKVSTWLLFVFKNFPQQKQKH